MDTINQFLEEEENMSEEELKELERSFIVMYNVHEVSTIISKSPTKLRSSLRLNEEVKVEIDRS